MKKILVVLALFAALIFVVSCGGGSSKIGDSTDTGEVVNDEDGDTADSGSTDTEPADNPDSENPDTAPDAGDSAPDNGDTTPDGGDSQPDDGDTEPDNDYPQTPCDPNLCLSDANSTGVCTINNNSYVCGCKSDYIFDGTLCIKSLPECSPSSDTPCIDSATGLIWSAKSENKMPWNDAINYCQNLAEGDFNDWRLPSINVLKTLVQNCYAEKCSDDYTGIYSKFGDTVYLWSSSEGEDSTAQSIYFSDASTQAVSIDVNVNVRCVRRESESRESNCTGLTENSVWNTATQITQTWDWETADWTPSPEGSYNTKGSTSECRFKCDSNSFGDGFSHCLNPCEPNPCNNIGETGICIGKSANEYRCECEDTYGWSSYLYECIKTPCRENSCNIPNSTGICNTITETQYACECSSGYYWHGKTEGCKSEPLTIGNICTGQTKCYNNSEEITCPTSSSEDFFGQDAYYTSLGECTTQSFSVQTISSQNVVVDNNTGLMWQQTIPTDEYEWADAVSYCNSLSYAGYSDWRLPTPKELLTIVDNDPAINTTYFFPYTWSAYFYFWSSSTCVGDTGYAWIVNFNFGDVTRFSNGIKESVCCVRGESLPSSTFETTTVNGDVVVTDTKTGLIWQKTYETGKNWQAALDYCENLTYAGYSDWRLPNKNELASLVNYEKHNPASDFPDMPSQYFWSSSTALDTTYRAWLVNFAYGHVDSTHGNAFTNSKTDDLNVRCVR